MNAEEDAELLTDRPGPSEPFSPPAPPRIVAVSGIVFAVLFTASLALIRLAVPADPAHSSEWLADLGGRESLRAALNLVPFCGIAFLWFMAVLRNRLGQLEDRFFATVFLGSGLLFVAMLLGSAAIAGAMLDTFGTEGGTPVSGEAYGVGRRTSHALLNVYGVRMAAVFVFVTSSLGLRTAFLPRWLALVGYATGLVLLLAIAEFAWIILLVPSWVLLVSANILFSEMRGPNRG